MQVWIWVGKIPLRRKWHPTPVLLPGEFHGQRSGLQSLGSQRVRHYWATNTNFSLYSDLLSRCQSPFAQILVFIPDIPYNPYSLPGLSLDCWPQCFCCLESPLSCSLSPGEHVIQGQTWIVHLLFVAHPDLSSQNHFLTSMLPKVRLFTKLPHVKVNVFMFVFPDRLWVHWDPKTLLNYVYFLQNPWLVTWWVCDLNIIGLSTLASFYQLPWWSAWWLCWSLMEAPIHIFWLPAILVVLSLSSPSLICCYVTLWQLNIPHGALPPNYNTHFAGQEIVLPSKWVPLHETNFVCVPWGRILISCRVDCTLLHMPSIAFACISISVYTHFLFLLFSGYIHSYPTKTWEECNHASSLMYITVGLQHPFNCCYFLT